METQKILTASDKRLIRNMNANQKLNEACHKLEDAGAIIEYVAKWHPLIAPDRDALIAIERELLNVKSKLANLLNEL
jgi:hypothetical protein